MGLLMCLTQPLVLTIIVAPFETLLPYTKKKKKFKNPPPSKKIKRLKTKNPSHVSMGWYKI
jgi:hypothetical protein